MDTRSLDEGVRILALVWRVVRLAGFTVVVGIVELGILTSDLPRPVLLMPLLFLALAAYGIFRPRARTSRPPATTTYTAAPQPLPMRWTAQALMPVGPIGRMEIRWPNGQLYVDHGRAVLTRLDPEHVIGTPVAPMLGPWEFAPSPQVLLVPVRAAEIDGGIAFRVAGVRDLLVFVQQRADVLAALATAGFAVQQAEEQLSVAATILG